MGLEHSPETKQGLPEITQEELKTYFSLSYEDKNQRLQEALNHFQTNHPELVDAIDANSHLEPPLQDPLFFRTMAVLVYMFFRQKLERDFSRINLRDYEKLARRLMGPDADNVLQEIAQMLYDENYHLNDMFIDSMNEKRLSDDIRHMNGAMVIYYLIRKAHLKAKRKRRSN